MDRDRSPPELVIDVHELSKRFGELIAVDGLELQVERGEIYGFLGPNGSGKTKAIRMLCGLLKPTSGRGTCLGYDLLTEFDEIKRHVGYMTQRFSLYEDLSVRETWTSSRACTGYRAANRSSMIASNGSASANVKGNWPGASPAAGSSGWHSLPACYINRDSCCSTNPPPGSIPRPGAISGTRSIDSPHRVSRCW